MTNRKKVSSNFGRGRMRARAVENLFVRQVSNARRVKFQILKPVMFGAFCLLAVQAWAGSWFIEPTASLVFPSDSKLVYHGMNGSVSYKDGYGVGLNAGRYIGSFKLYLSYDYSHFRAQNETLSTPYGQVSQGDSDLFQSHTILFNANYSFKSLWGIRPILGVGMGTAVNSSVSGIFEGRCGLSKKLEGMELSLLYSYRWTDGQEKFGHKSDGSYSIVMDNPNEQLLTLSISKRF